MSTGRDAAGGRLVVFSPLPPSRSGIAAYTAELVPFLAPHFAGGITVVVARDADVVAQPGAEVVGERDYRRRPALAAAPHLYQLGNSLDQEHVYRAALRRPGAVVLHEVVLHHLVEALTLGRGSDYAYEAALEREHGPAGRRLARLRRSGLFSPWQRFLLPLHRHVLEAARGVIVHSRYAAGRLQAPPGLPVRVIPHLLSPAVAGFDGLTRSAARERLGVTGDAPLLLMLGHVTPPKQAALVLEALAILHRAPRRAGAPPPPRLVIGGVEEAGLDLAAHAARLGLQDELRLTGWLEEAEFFAWLRAADLLIGLRFPPAGETSGTLVRALGMGTPALVHDLGPAAELPDAVVAKLPFTRDEDGTAAALLARRLETLLADPARLAALGAAARDHLRATAAPGDCAAAYAEAIRAWDGG